MDCFEKALQLDPSFSPYLANIGQALKETGREGAAEFLRRLAAHSINYPSSVSDYVTSIAAECQTLIGNSDGASKLRRAQMDANSTNPAIYVAEAEYQLEIGGTSKAIEILDKVDRLGYGNSYTLVVRAKAIQLNGDGAAASALRLAQIHARDPHPALYVDEAEYQLGLGDTATAMRMIDHAETFAYRSPYTLSMRAKIMEASGDGAGASDFRYVQIADNSPHPALYNAEAEFQILKGDKVEALRLLDLAARRGCVDSYTPSIRARALGH